MRAYGALIEEAKRVHWEGFLVWLDERSVWMVHQYMSEDPKTEGGLGYLHSKAVRPAWGWALSEWLRQIMIRAVYCVPPSFLSSKVMT